MGTSRSVEAVKIRQSQESELQDQLMKFQVF